MAVVDGYIFWHELFEDPVSILSVFHCRNKCTSRSETPSRVSDESKGHRLSHDLSAKVVLLASLSFARLQPHLALASAHEYSINFMNDRHHCEPARPASISHNLIVVAALLFPFQVVLLLILAPIILIFNDICAPSFGASKDKMPNLQRFVVLVRSLFAVKS